MSPLPIQQKALLLEEKFGPLVLSSTFPVPQPREDEVLVRIHSAALNPVDWKIQKAGFFVDKFPGVLGTDIAGDVVELGEGVKERGTFKVGDRVFFQGIYNENEHAGFQQYATADVLTLAKIPANVTYDEASTLPVTLTAAYLGLYNANPYGLDFDPPVRPGAKGKYAGVPIVVFGGSSSVGQAAIQLASLSGFSPIITTSSLRHTSFLKSLGATHVVDRNIPLTKSVIRDITSVGIGSVFDAISSHDTQEQGLDVLASGGQITVVLNPAEDLAKRAESEGKRYNRVVGAKTLPETVDLLRELWPKLYDLLATGEIKPNPVEVLPNGLNGIIGGLKKLEDNRVSGMKLVSRPRET